MMLRRSRQQLRMVARASLDPRSDARHHHPDQHFTRRPPEAAGFAGRIGAQGIEGDAHAHPQIHGGPRKAMLLIAAGSGRRSGRARLSGLLRRPGREPHHARHRRPRAAHRRPSARRRRDCSRSPSRAGPARPLDVYGETLKRRDLYDPRVKAARPDFAALGHERVLRQRGGAGAGGAGRYNCSRGQVA